MKKVLQRSEIAPEYRWNLDDLYPSMKDWESEFDAVVQLLPQLKQFEGKLVLPTEIASCFRLMDAIGRRADQLYSYAYFRHHENTSSPAGQGPVSRVDKLMVDLREAASFVEPELLGLPEDRLRAIVDSTEMAFYRFTMEKLLRRKPHTLPKEQEAIVARAGMLAQAPQTIYGMVNDADMRFPSIRDEQGNDVEVTHARYSRFLESFDRRVRRDAFQARVSSYRKQQNTIASLFNANAMKDLFYARTLRYPSSLAMALFEDNIPTDVYHNLIATVRAELPVFHRYLRLRKRELGLDELHTYDLYTPLVPKLEWSVPFEEARSIVLEAIGPMGKEYREIAEQALSGRWFDVFENEGKHSGAYSWGVYGIHPYVLLNHEGSLNDVFTVAHELGHAIHSFLSSREQDYHYAGYSIFVAEIASTLNEALLLHHLLRTASDRARRAYLLTHFADGFRGTVIVQTLFAEFEKKIHELAEEGTPLTLETINRIFFTLHQEYYGPEVVLDPDVEIGWMRIPHFYSSYYVYKYATGFSAAQFLSKRILNRIPGGVDLTLELLKSGGKDYPLNLLAKAGVDMASPEPIREAFGAFGEAVGELEELLGRK